MQILAPVEPTMVLSLWHVYAVADGSVQLFPQIMYLRFKVHIIDQTIVATLIQK